MHKQYDYLLHESLAQKKWASEKTYSLENNPDQFYSIDYVMGSLNMDQIEQINGLWYVKINY